MRGGARKRDRMRLVSLATYHRGRKTMKTGKENLRNREKKVARDTDRSVFEGLDLFPSVVGVTWRREQGGEISVMPTHHAHGLTRGTHQSDRKKRSSSTGASASPIP